MSDILYINGETVDVEKKFDTCVIEGIEDTTSPVSARTLIIPLNEKSGSGGLKVEVMKDFNEIKTNVSVVIDSIVIA